MDDYDHVMTYVKKDGTLLYFAAPELKSNKNIVLEAVREYPRSFQFASDKLRSDEKFVANCMYELYKQNQKERIPELWRAVGKEVKQKYNNVWETLIASHYHGEEFPTSYVHGNILVIL
jgi:hypothetical protein